MAYANFWGGLFHVGGQSDFYNLFIITRTFFLSIVFYYSALVMAEAWFIQHCGRRFTNGPSRSTTANSFATASAVTLPKTRQAVHRR
jgi:hypothetical protein